MYNFFKVRGQKYRHEFRHPFFKRDGLENLKYIRRKHVKKMSKANLNQNSKKNGNFNTHFANTKLSKMEEILHLMVQQNQSLININNQMTSSLKIAETDCPSKLKNFFELTIRAIKEPYSDLFNQCKDLLKKTAPMMNNLTPKALTYFLTTPNRESCSSNSLDFNISLIVEELDLIYQDFKKHNLDNLHEACSINTELEYYQFDFINQHPYSLNHKDMCNMISTQSPSLSYAFNANDHIRIAEDYSSQVDMSPTDRHSQLVSPLYKNTYDNIYMTVEDMNYEIFINNLYEGMSPSDENCFFSSERTRDI